MSYNNVLFEVEDHIMVASPLRRGHPLRSEEDHFHSLTAGENLEPLFAYD